MRTNPLRLFLPSALLLVLLAAQAHADPVTITFNPPPGGQEQVTSYTEQGFTFNSPRNMFIRTINPTGNAYLESNSGHVTTPTTIRIEFGGGTFDFLGADLLFSSGAGNVFRASNGYVFTVSGSGSFDPGGVFLGITWLEWVHYGDTGDPDEPGPNPAGMDNFRFNTNSQNVTTPEPATVLLLGSGLLGTLKVARRKRGA